MFILGLWLSSAQLIAQELISVQKPALLPEKPQRIMTSTVDADELTYEIMARSKRLSSLIGVSKLADNRLYSNLTNQAQSIPHRFGHELESLIKLKPDLVILSEFNQAAYFDALDRLKISYIKLSGAKQINDIYRNINHIGQSVDLERAAKTLISSLKNEVKHLKESAHLNDPTTREPLKVLAYLPTGHYIGRETLFDEYLRILSAENAVKQSGWPKLSDETVLNLDVDIIVYPVKESSDKHLSKAREVLANTSAVSKLPAFRKGKIIFIPNRLLSATSHRFIDTLALLKKDLARFQPSVRKPSAQSATSPQTTSLTSQPPSLIP